MESSYAKRFLPRKTGPVQILAGAALAVLILTSLALCSPRAQAANFKTLYGDVHSNEFVQDAIFYSGFYGTTYNVTWNDYIFGSSFPSCVDLLGASCPELPSLPPNPPLLQSTNLAGYNSFTDGFYHKLFFPDNTYASHRLPGSLPSTTNCFAQARTKPGAYSCRITAATRVYELNWGSGTYTILNGGPRIVKVPGHLHIRSNMEFDPNLISGTDWLPSFVVVVSGGLIIDPGVTKIAGTYIVDADLNVSTDSNYFLTSDSFNALTVEGSVIARRFKFLRQGAADAVSESIIYNPVAIVNPSPYFSNPADVRQWQEAVPD